jgi:hypothetical protein
MSNNFYNYESDTSDDEFNRIYQEFEYLESKKKRRRRRILGYESDSDEDERDHRFSEELKDKHYCVAILKSGKNKGKICGIRRKTFMYDFSLCGHHLRAYHTSGFITIKA